MSGITYSTDQDRLTAEIFIAFMSICYPNKSFKMDDIVNALSRTINISAWENNKLVGTIRILSDGVLFSTIPEIVVHPEYRGQGIGSQLMKIALTKSPTGLFFGAKSGNEPFFEKLGCKKGPQSYIFYKNNA